MDVRASRPLRKITSLYGIGGKNLMKGRLIFTAVLGIYITFQSFLAVYMNWGDVFLRFQALEDIEVNCFCIASVFEQLFTPWILEKELVLIDEPYFDYKYRLTETKVKEMKNRNEEQKWQIQFFISTAFFYHITLYYPPVILAFWKVLSGEEIQYHLLLVSECWFPFKISSFLVYLLIVSTNILFGVLVFHNVCPYLAAPMGVQHKIATELRLLKLSLEEIDHFIYHRSISLQRNSLESIKTESEEEICWSYFKQIVEHHKFIYRQLQEINKALNVSGLNVWKATTVVGCLNMYCLFEFEEIHNKIRYTLAIVSVFLLLFSYSTNGHEIQNQGEQLKDAMYGCCWLEKPLWFKKSLLMMMTRAHRSMEVKPMGLFVLNYNNFASIINGAYAYCNFLRTTRH